MEKETRFFSRKTLKKSELTEQINKKKIFKLHRNCYTKKEQLTLEDRFIYATTHLRPPSAIALLSALHYYNLADQPDKIWAIVPFTKRTKLKNLKLWRTRNPFWNIEIDKKNSFCITSLERTIVDCIRYKKQLKTNIGIEALKIGITQKKTTFNKIIACAQKLKCTKSIFPIIEVLI